METNVGSIDRSARILVGGVFVVLTLWGNFTSLIQMVLVFFGIFLLATGLMGYAPEYVPLGKNTATQAKRAAKPAAAKKRKK